MDHKLKGITSKKERRLSQNVDVLGVCLVAKHAARRSTGRHTGLRTGSVVRGLSIDYSKERIFLVTSEKIVREEELVELKRGKKVLNASDYTLYFLSSSDPHSHSEPPKTHKLRDITNLSNSKEQVVFSSGLVIIPIASEKLSKNSGLKTYRSFEASTEVTELKELNDSICQIIEGSTKSIDVKSYKIEFIDNKCALSLPEKETTHSYKNWTELTAGGAMTNLYPYGAVILKSGCAVAVLNFVGDKISPVCLSKVQFSGNSEATSRKNSLAEGTKESKKMDDISSDTKLSKQIVCSDLNTDAESSKSSLTEEESKNGDAIRPGISTKDGKLSTDEKPDQSESANGVEAQFGGSRARRMKKTDPHKEPGAIQKRPKQVNSLKPETSSSKDTWAEETDESKEKNDIFSKGETLPVQESSESSLAKGRSKEEDAICLGSLGSTMCGEISGQGGSKIAIPNPKNGASASPDKDKDKKPGHENNISPKENRKEDLKSIPVENDEENEMKLKVALKGLSAEKKNQEPRAPSPGSSECFCSKTSSTNGNDEFEREDDASSENNELIKQTVCWDLNSEPNNSILDEGECKDGDAIPPESSTKDGKLYRGRKSEESESAHEVKKKKEIDPYKGTGAIPKRPKQGKSSKPETSSSKDTLAEETDKSKEKNHEFSKDKILPYAVEESSKSSLPKGESKKEDTISPGRSTVDGKLSGDRKPDQSERTKGVGTQVGGSGSGLKDSASSKNTFAEGAGGSKKKGDIPAKVEILPVQDSPFPSNTSQLPRTNRQIPVSKFAGHLPSATHQQTYGNQQSQGHHQSEKYSKEVKESMIVKTLPYRIYSKICIKLNIRRNVTFKDFRMVAEELGMDRDIIDLIGQEKNPAECLFKEHCPNVTVLQLLNILYKIDRSDVALILEGWIKDFQ